MLEGLCIPAGLETPWDIPGRAGGGRWGEICLGTLHSILLWQPDLISTRNSDSSTLVEVIVIIAGQL